MNDKNFSDIYSLYAKPMMLRGVLNSMMHTADRLVAAIFIGTKALVATTVASPLLYFIYAVSALFIGGLGAYVGLLIGRDDSKKASETASGVLIVLLAVGIVLFVPTFIFSNNLAQFLGARDSVFSLTSTYLRVLSISFPFMLVGRSLDVLICNDGSPKYSFWLNMITTTLNFVLNIISVAVLDMGIMGLAISTVISEGVQTIGAAIYFITRSTSIKLKKPKIEISRLLRIAYNGLSDFAMLIVDAVMVYVVNMAFVRYLTPEHFEAYAVVNIIMILFYAIFMGATGGLQPIFSQWMGKGEYDSLKSLLKYSVKRTTVVGGLAYILCLISIRPILGLFLGDGNTLEYGIYFYMTIGFAVLFSNLPLQCSLFFTAINRPMESAAISVLRTLILIPILSYVGIMLIGPLGLGVGLLLTDLILIGLILIYMNKVDISKLTVME